MKQLLLAGAAALVLSTAPAAASDIMLAQQVYDNCLTTDSMCTFYIAGIWDGLVEAHDSSVFGLPATKTETQDWLCGDGPDSYNDERKIFIKYIHEHPDQLKYAAGYVVAKAFNAAFPCK